MSTGDHSLVAEHEAINSGLYDHHGHGRWPHGTIPKRVKKLSWEDELYSQVIAPI